MLNMRSARHDAADDRTARARIRDAAISRFAADGVAATSVRAIAAEAGVSPGLVIHHFGSKDALRHACDEHVAEVIRANKRQAMQAGAGFDPVAALRDADDQIPLTQYLAGTLVDGTPHVAELIDELVEDAVGYMQVGVEAGTLRPSEHPYERAAILTIWSLGALLLHDHVERLLGVDLTRRPSTYAGTEAATRYLAPALELLSGGLIDEEVATAMRDAFLPPPDDPTEAS
jgi:AcrR family transcriptional regulator